MKGSIWRWFGGTVLLAGLLAVATVVTSCTTRDVVIPSDAAAQQAALAFVEQGVREDRGRILAVLTSTARFGPKQKNAGYELTELSRAYYVFRANGYAVDFASPRGGKPPVNIDQDDMQAIDHAFLNDAEIQQRIEQSLALADVDPSQYAGVYFVGGKGAMFDFPENPDVPRIVKHLHAHGVVGAVCHGPAALFNVLADNGEPLIRGRQITGFTNEEELFLIENAREVFPYLLQDKAEQLGARFAAAPRYLNHVVVDGRLVTGQNPWSTWGVAEAMIRALGHTPVARPITPEERSVDILARYHSDGLDAALALREQHADYDPLLIRLHALIAAMEWQLIESSKLLRLAGV